MFDRLLQSRAFNIINGSKKIKPNMCAVRHLVTYRVDHCTNAAFIVLGLYGLSRSHRLYKQISAESKIPLPNPPPPLTLILLVNIQLLFNSRHACQMMLINTKSTGLVHQGAGVFNCWAARLD